MPLITLMYKSGAVQVKEVSFNVRRIHGLKLKGHRPIEAILPDGFSYEFIKNLKIMMHPLEAKISYLEPLENIT